MVQDSRLTIMHLPLSDHERVKEALEGYHDVVLTYNDNLSDSYTNDLALKYFIDTVHAAREAGVARIIVVGSPPVYSLLCYRFTPSRRHRLGIYLNRKQLSRSRCRRNINPALPSRRIHGSVILILLSRLKRQPAGLFKSGRLCVYIKIIFFVAP